jgi:RimJ/RimL family protein N-acetyltransferase
MPFVKRCWDKYGKYFQDDFSLEFSECNFLKMLKNCYFWVVLDSAGNFKGFVFLDNFVGDEKHLYSAEVTTCFDRSAWGIFPRYSAKFFLKKCFDDFGLHKIKAQIYPDNFRVRNYLKSCGFEYETTLKNETLRMGKSQDIEVYALYRNYYYKL